MTPTCVVFYYIIMNYETATYVNGKSIGIWGVYIDLGYTYYMIKVSQLNCIMCAAWSSVRANRITCRYYIKLKCYVKQICIKTV